MCKLFWFYNTNFPPTRLWKKLRRISREIRWQCSTPEPENCGKGLLQRGGFELMPTDHPSEGRSPFSLSPSSAPLGWAWATVPFGKRLIRVSGLPGLMKSQLCSQEVPLWGGGGGAHKHVLTVFEVLCGRNKSQGLRKERPGNTYWEKPARNPEKCLFNNCLVMVINSLCIAH